MKPLALLALVIATLASFTAEARQWGEMASRPGTKRIAPSAASDHTCFIRADHVIQCWGNNTDGQLGQGGTGSGNTVPTVVPGISDAVDIAVGARHTCAVLVSGQVRCWGSNATGQLGVGSATQSSSVPLAVSSITTAISIAAGDAHTCARLSNGTVRCWGANTDGQLGDGTTTGPRFTPVTASGLSDATSVAVGSNHTCAVRANGSLSCWGASDRGQLGLSGTSRRTVPTAVPTVVNVTSVATGNRFTCARQADGRLFCWGDNSDGQLSTAVSGGAATAPVQVFLPSSVIDIVTAGGDHACGTFFRSQTGYALACWGRDSNGQLGGTPSGSSQLAFSTGGMESTAGRAHTCTLMPGDLVLCAGDNSFGQLGNGTNAQSETFVNALGVAGGLGARVVGAGNRHSCAVRANGTIDCWGENAGNQTAAGFPTDRLVPTPVALPSSISLVREVALGGEHSCVTAHSPPVPTTSCWGDNRNRQAFPFGESVAPFIHVDVIDPTDAYPLTAPLVWGVAAGAFHSCELNSAGTVRCWGSNASAQLGTTEAVLYNQMNVSEAVAVVSGTSHSCALRADGTVQCWGSNTFGQLGNGSTSAGPFATPQQAAGLTNVVAITAGADHTCALRVNGQVACWGRNDFMQADGSTAALLRVPTLVPGIAVGEAAGVTAGATHTCALRVDGVVRCWGANSVGQLGNATTTASGTPVTVRLRRLPFGSVLIATTPMNQVTGVVAGSAHNCLIRAGGGVFCWGRNPSGQLGDNSTATRTAAVAVGSFTSSASAP